ncbi:hypothetical protein DERP_006457 [Dermatophagoides pteronyssinus]|uniref:Uncharacterized protein n=1 Tax=Dermatophagoides pteronyssinus TaxID=6956 RepID=A0ABQ8IQN0_DERPT|nr:hypothetical protein DERP_006457 [Dermatophagoides pteronyssinus]
MNIIKDNDGHNVITKCDPSSLSSKSSSKSSTTKIRINCPKHHPDSSKIDDNTGTEKIKSPRSRSRQRTNVPHHDKQYLNQKQQQQTSPSSSSNKTNRHSLNNNSRKIDDFCHDNHCQQNNDDHQKQQSTDIDHKQSISSTTTKCLTKKKSKNKMIDNEINPTDFDCNNQYVDQPQQHEPLSQVLVTLKSQNQNLIKEVEDLRIKLEDAEAIVDLRLFAIVDSVVVVDDDGSAIPILLPISKRKKLEKSDKTKRIRIQSKRFNSFSILLLVNNVGSIEFSKCCNIKSIRLITCINILRKLLSCNNN